MRKLRTVHTDPESYKKAMLNSLYQMQKNSLHTDCVLMPSDGTIQGVPVHLAVLSLAWPGLHNLLPTNSSHCSCQCCVPSIAIVADTETVQKMVELIYTGKTVLEGMKEGEAKVMKLLQSLGIHLLLEKVEEKGRTSSGKKTLEEGFLLLDSYLEETVPKSLLDLCSISPDNLGRIKDMRKSLPRRVKITKPVNLSILSKKKKKVEKSRMASKNNDSEMSNAIPTLSELPILAVSHPPMVKTDKTMIAPGTLMSNVENHVQFFCSFCEENITHFSKAEKESHWSVVHYSEQLLNFTQQKVCKLCNLKLPGLNDAVKHIGVSHKKIYELINVLPSEETALIIQARINRQVVQSVSYRRASGNSTGTSPSPSNFQGKDKNEVKNTDDLLSDRRCNTCDRIFRNPSSLRRHKLSIGHKKAKTGDT